MIQFLFELFIYFPLIYFKGDVGHISDGLFAKKWHYYLYWVWNIFVIVTQELPWLESQLIPKGPESNLNSQPTGMWECKFTVPIFRLLNIQDVSWYLTSNSNQHSSYLKPSGKKWLTHTHTCIYTHTQFRDGNYL